MNSVNNNYPCLPSSSTSCVPGAYSETPTQQFPIGDGGVYVDDYEPVHHEDDDIGGGGVYTDDYEPVHYEDDDSGDGGVSVGDYEPVHHEVDDKWIIEPDDDGLGFYDSSSEEDNSVCESFKSLSVSKTICCKTSKSLPLMKREQVEIVPGDMYVINVDGYYRKWCKGSRAKGGYGVIIRRMDGESIIAKTGCAQVGVSEFFTQCRVLYRA
ncbi:uncharacterized protein LOC113361257 [Papaver somniferum]|uniref:uncharacterized protein LOC113361257 n=1 Tax=Papaver somniferum TaxID=3469 RepID=UPI000E6FBC39|nr:uncharacterized protein LOC113361257 [Papaver somniferum]XP_026460343.1 uncharacterized protein LOC113361257 [Papaver somniferum]